MAQVGSAGTRKLTEKLAGSTGISAAIAALSESAGVQLQPIAAEQIVAQNVAADLIERSSAVRYPSIHVYCERLSNTLREKFRIFSGKAHLVIEVRVSQDRIEDLERQAQLYVDAATKVLDEARGDWGDGFFHSGGYDVTYAPVKRGGKSYLQTAKIAVEVDVSL